MNLGDYFEAVVHRAPQAIAIVDEHVRWSYADLARETERLASSLWSVGLRPRDRVMVLLGNRRENVVIFWACQKLGLVYVPVNSHFAPNDIAYCIEDAEPEVLFFDNASEMTIDALVGRGKLAKAVYFVGEHEQPPFKSYAALHETGELASPHIAAGDDAIAVMLYSSGATGKPKGIPRSHTNELSATTAHIIHNAYSFYESTVAISSFCHTMGLRMLLAMALLNGKLVLPPDDAPDTYLALMSRKVSQACMPSQSSITTCLMHASAYHLKSVKKVAYAGAPMSKAIVEQCLTGFTAETFVNHFGSTEIYTYTICSWLARKPLCAGKAGINTQLRLVLPMNTTVVLPNQEVGAGEVGELIVKLTSPEAFKGYWNRPDLTAKTIAMVGSSRVIWSG